MIRLIQKSFLNSTNLSTLVFMNIVIQSALNTLKKSEYLLENLSDESFCDASISPYYSSIGSHLRHILDFYDCIFNVDDGKIDLTARSRNKSVESECNCAIEYLNRIKKSLQNFSHDIASKIIVIDDLGLGKIEMEYTYAALFSQANSHTIHHYAIINYIIDRLGIEFKDEDFGYNPTTPKTVVNN